MDAEQTIADIERLERIFAAPDTRPLAPSDLAAANRRHDEMLAHSPWLRLWHFGRKQCKFSYCPPFVAICSKLFSGREQS